MSDEPHSPYRVVVSEETAGAQKHHAPAAARNTGPILDVLREILPTTGRALEIASGTGQHCAAFAGAFPGIEWQPSDQDAAARASIAAWVAETGQDNLLPPLGLDVSLSGWGGGAGGEFDLIVCINMIHISPWAACMGLMEGAGALLRPGGLLYLYGPYMDNGDHTAPSNAAFDESLRRRNPAWGIRDMGAVEAAASARGILLEGKVAMPANNFSLIFRKQAG
jgi:SAM-dependent methyltransferase